MKITYNGTPGESHDAIFMYGQFFPRGKAVEVEDAFASRKLANHPHFSHSGAAEEVVDKRLVKAAELIIEVQQDEAAELKQQEDDTIAALTEEEKYGDTDPASTPSAAEVEGLGSQRVPQRGRPRKGT
jgi:hypothetical protein